jgi:heme/copper-type cytochrome/quinol oxidase subunit 1
MEIIIGIAILAAIVWVAYNHFNKESAGSNPSDGPTAPYKVEPNLTTKADGIGHESIPAKKSALDVNQDGKVDIKDAVEAVKKTKAKAKKVADEVVTEVKTVAKKTVTKVKAVPAKKATKAKTTE